ncbi:MAG TPA: M50 family metallopeptidase, partial [Gemmataceae bacterium]|nr:M50 family metallopeptidase [Gemmataceae bacterium]
MKRLHQSVLIVSTISASWLGMQAVHECGHVLGAWVTCGEVNKVVLHPLTLSRTDLKRNPHPLVVVWAGPCFGVLFPLALWG